MRRINVAVIGATGAVGEMFLNLMTARAFPLDTLYPLASEHSVGKAVSCQNRSFMVEQASTFDFSKVHLAFFSAGSAVAKALVPKAVAAGCTVIDNSAAFRGMAAVPLVVPEINGHLLKASPTPKMIANPNCATIPFCLACAPLRAHYGVVSAEVVTFQSVSGSGRVGVSRLASEAIAALNGGNVSSEVGSPYCEDIAFNVVPFIDEMTDNGFTAEEMKLYWETQKIFEDATCLVNSTTVRVPVFYGHSEAVTVKLCGPFDLEHVRTIMADAPGVCVIDEADAPLTPRSHGVDTDPVFVSRLRRSLTDPHAVTFWLVSDNLRKGAALNSIQIAEQWLTVQNDAHHAAGLA